MSAWTSFWKPQVAFQNHSLWKKRERERMQHIDDSTPFCHHSNAETYDHLFSTAVWFGRME